MHRSTKTFCALLIAVGAFHSPQASADGHLTVLDDENATALVHLEFGLRHPAPRDWSGEVSASPGQTLSLWGWHFSRPDRTLPGGRFDFQVRAYRPEDAPYGTPYDLPNGRTVLPNGIFVSLEAPEHARVAVRTNHGDFEFELAELRAAGRLAFLDGDVAATYMPPVSALTRGEASQHDFPAAVYAGGDLYVAWTTYVDEANVIYLARRSNGEWTTHRVTPEWGDFYGTAIAADGEGLVHVIWSEFRDSRWRLLDRAFDAENGQWKRSQYIAPGGDRQYFPEAITDAEGRPWVVWQEFEGDNLNILMARLEEGRWSAPLRVSPSSANDWSPAIAAAPNGSVWIAWDSYDAGNYDVFVREIRDGELQPPVQVTRAPTRDAFASIAVDSKNRLWVAWAEAGPRWGKDWGVLGRPGTQIREDSRIRLVRFADGRWREPASPLEDHVPAWMGNRHAYPRLVIGPADTPYVLFHHWMHRAPILEHALKLRIPGDERLLQPWYDTIRGMSSIHLIGFDGARWLPSRRLPLSDGGAYAKLAIAPHPSGATLVWPTDGRTYLDPHFRTSQLRFADLPVGVKLAGPESLRSFASPASDDGWDHAGERRDLQRLRAVRWDDREPLQLFRGDLHRHTDLSADSEADGDILLAYRYALDPGALDFLAVTDHSGAERHHYYRYQWWRTRQIATMFNQPGRFAAFFGYERTVTYPGGHRNVISTRRNLQPVPISDEEFTGTESWAERLYPSLLAGGDIAIAHTTAGGGGTDWRDNDPRVEPVVEIFQALRGSYEEPNTPAKARGTNQPEGFVWTAWRKGHKLGVIADSDHSSTHQSYACVYAPRLTAEAIHEGIKRRLTYAATDNIMLQFEAAGADTSRVKMGGEARISSPPRFEIAVEGTSGIDTVELIRNGRVVHAVRPAQPSLRISFVDNEALAGEAYYHLRLVQQDEQIAWSSPIWIDPR